MQNAFEKRQTKGLLVQKNSEVEFADYSAGMMTRVGVVVHVASADLMLQTVVAAAAAAAVNAASPLHSVHRLDSGWLRHDSILEYEDDGDWRVHGTAVGTFGVAAADGVGVNEQVGMSGLRKRHLTHQTEGLLGCCLG